MATKFLEPGGDADFLVGTTNGFWSGISGTIATDFVHGGHIKSIKYAPNTTQFGDTKSSILANAGNRISVYIYLVALPNATANLVNFHTTPGTDFDKVSIRITSGGALQLWNDTAQIGTNGATLSTGVWYRISLAYTITSNTVNRFELFVDGVSSISVTDATLTTGTLSFVRIGNSNTNATLDFRSSDHYIDDSTSLTDPGNIWVTAKRPTSNGTAVEFTTQIGAGGSGYGTGHSPQVNERALSVTNGWSISTTTRKTEEYNIEATSVGDIDISAATIVDYLGWISASVDSTANSPVHRIMVNGTLTAKTMSTTTTMFTQIAGSATYPAGTGTDIGMDAQYTTTPHLTRLFECGIVVAYIPAVVATNTTNFFF